MKMMHAIERIRLQIITALFKLHQLYRQVINRSLSGSIFGIKSPCINGIKVSDKFNSFCTYPFFSINILSDGTAKPCCAFRRCIEKNGISLSIYKNTIDEIWNSKDMRDIRRSMVEGRPVGACNYCYNHEREGLRSMRMKNIDNWNAGFLNPSFITIDQVKVQAKKNNYYYSEGPELFDLDVGTVCNLRCRECHAFSSSAIASDPIQSSWSGSPPKQREEIAHSRLAGGVQWFRDQEFLKGELFGNPKKIKKIQLIGGEPLLIKEIRNILRLMIDLNIAPNILFVFATNGTYCDQEWLELSSKFSKISMAVSIDGFGPINEYLRFPSKWQNIEVNVEKFVNKFNPGVFVNMTVQTYNVLNIIELADFCSRLNVTFRCHLLQYPDYLSPFVLPHEIRCFAANRLRSYVKTLYMLPDSIQSNIQQTVSIWNTTTGKELEMLVYALENGPREFNADLMRRFMLFTNDLDASRGQSFAATFPELRGMIEDAGIHWIDDRFFYKDAQVNQN